MPFGIIKKLLGGSDIVKDIGDAIDKNITNDEERMEAHRKWYELQTQVNFEEAKHRSVFIAGWRPFLGWSFSIGISLHVVIMPMVQWVLLVCGIKEIPLPEFPLEIMLELIFGMLGMAGLRTYEKFKGLTK